jgi:hypothetical protein
VNSSFESSDAEIFVASFFQQMTCATLLHAVEVVGKAPKIIKISESDPFVEDQYLP